MNIAVLRRIGVAPHALVVRLQLDTDIAGVGADSAGPHILHGSAAVAIRLDVQNAFGGAGGAVEDVDIAHIARHFAANGVRIGIRADGAAAADDDVFARSAAPGIRVAAGFDRDVVV